MYSISEKIQKQLIFAAIVIFTIIILTIFSIIINYQKKQKDLKNMIDGNLVFPVPPDDIIKK